MKSILVVDDSVIYQRSLKNIVSSDFDEVTVAGDGDTALEVYKKIGPQVVLLDVTMPNKDGKTCLKEILDFDSRACVIMISAIKAQATVEQCLSLGARAFINKSDIKINDKDSQQRVLEIINSSLSN